MRMGSHPALESRGYMAVFAALLALTVVTVAASLLDAPAAAAVTIGLAIAGVKAALVALYFMHLRHERRLIHMALALTAVFCVGLFALTLWTEADHAPGTRFGSAFDAATP
jgi:cytochrome c oxidase subunit 4